MSEDSNQNTSERYQPPKPPRFTRGDIAAMSHKEYMENRADILAQQRRGEKFEDDIDRPVFEANRQEQLDKKNQRMSGESGANQ